MTAGRARRRWRVGWRCGAGVGVRRAWCVGSWLPTPHLASPWKGGGMNWGRVGSWLGGSCLRRNDERGRRNDEREDAGMTEGAGGMEV